MSYPNSRLLVSAVLVILFWLPGCNGSPRNVEKPIPVTKQPQAAPAAPPVKQPPPTQAEVENKIHRIFGDDVMVQHGASPFFILGDFNGDGSEDLAVIVRAAGGKLDHINGEFANWIIQDANTYFVAPPGKHTVSVPKIPEAKVTEREPLLAVIHGHGAKGWRTPEAQQAYLVKHAAATFLGTAPSFSLDAIRAMHLPIETDVIKEIREGKNGFLFWTGGAYAWHPSEG